MEKVREYELHLEEDTKAYIYIMMEHGVVKEFVVKLLSRCQGEWHEIVRYDSGHGCPHKDILNADGEVIRKIWYDFLDDGQALTMAITDIKDNHEVYKERFERWLKEL